MWTAFLGGLRSAALALSVGGWRLALASGLAAGLALAPLLEVGEGPLRPAAMLACLLVLTGLRSRFGRSDAVLVVTAALLTGLTVGNARLAAIDGRRQWKLTRLSERGDCSQCAGRSPAFHPLYLSPRAFVSMAWPWAHPRLTSRTAFYGTEHMPDTRRIPTQVHCH